MRGQESLPHVVAGTLEVDEVVRGGFVRFWPFCHFLTNLVDRILVDPLFLRDLFLCRQEPKSVFSKRMVVGQFEFFVRNGWHRSCKSFLRDTSYPKKSLERGLLLLFVSGVKKNLRCRA